MGEGKIKRISYGCHYFFVKPGKNGDVHRYARRLIDLKEVHEVLVTEGEYGFVIRARERYPEEDMMKKINTLVKGDSSGVVCHCRYTKR